MQHSDLTQTRRWVVKMGSALLTANGQGLDLSAISDWVEQLVFLRKQGFEIIIVSSGSIAEGMARLGWSKRLKHVHELQAAAAVGQMGLVQTYEEVFKKAGIRTAQILLTHDDLADRKRYINARSTLNTLLGLGIVPIVNENDTVTTDEIRFGDNDTLGALVANLVTADVLVILTDVAGLHDKNPSEHTDAQLIQRAAATDKSLLSGAGPSANQLGRGGMFTKVQAAARAARSGTSTVIACGHHPQILKDLAHGRAIGTLLFAEQAPLDARKQWLANRLRVRGELVMDQGAVHVLKNSGSSLLAVGVVRVCGHFMRGDLVSCQSQHGEEVARGLVNYSAEEAKKLIGKPSAEIEAALGYVDEPELIHRDNLIVFT